MKHTCLIFCIVALFSGSVSGETQPSPTQYLDTILRLLRVVQKEMQKQSQEPSDRWQQDLVDLTDPLLQASSDLYRSSASAGTPTPAYGLRIMLNVLRASRDPKHAVSNAEELVQMVSFLRSEYQLAAKQATPQTASFTRTQIRDVLLGVLQRAEFQQATKPSVFDYWLNKIIVKVIAWLRSIFDSQAMRQTGKYAYIFLWAVYGIGGASIIWFIYRAWSPRRKVTQTDAEASSRAAGLLTPDAHRAEAEAFAKAGSYAAAMRSYFLMMLAQLEQQQIVARNRTWTNSEYVRAFGHRVSDRELCSRMSLLTARCDRVSYGGDACDESGFLNFRTEVEGFLESVATVST
jgi:hypothetical protein